MRKYIEAEAYKAAHKNAYESAMMECGDGEDTRLSRRVYEAVIKSVDVFPAADVAEVRHGKWEYKEEHKGSKYGYYYCSICGMSSWASNSPYCPNCGSRMDLEGEEE